MFIKENQRITDDDILKKAPEIEELYQIIFFYKSKEIENSVKELNRIQLIYAKVITSPEKMAMRLYNEINKYNKITDSAIKEYGAIFEEEFKDKYDGLDIIQELKIFNAIINVQKGIGILNMTKLIDQSAAYFIKSQISQYGKEKELKEIYGEYPNERDIFLPANSTIIKEILPETDYIVDDLIRRRFKGKKIKSILDYKNKEEKETLEYEKFNEMLNLIPDENIIKLKEEYLQTVLKIFEEYLKIKERIKNTIDKNQNIINVDVFLMLKYICDLLKELQEVLTPEKEEKEEKESDFTREQTGARKRIREYVKTLDTAQIAFIIFYMIEKEDPLSEMVITTKNILNLIIYDLPISGINSYLSSSPGISVQAIENDEVEIICTNPEADFFDLNFIIKPKKDKTANEQTNQKELTLNQFTNNITGITNLYEENNTSEKIKEALLKSGLNEEKATQLTFALSLGYIIGDQIQELKISNVRLNQCLNAKKLEKQKNSETQNLQSPTDETLQTENKKMKEETESLKQKNKRLESKIKELKEYIKKETVQKAKEMANDFLLELIDKDLEIQEEEIDIKFPQAINKKIVVFGGHETWVNHMKEFLPGLTYVNKDKNPDEQLIRNADSVWIQTNAISHTFYHKVANIIKNTGFKNIKFCRSSSASDCARRIYLEEKE